MSAPASATGVGTAGCAAGGVVDIEDLMGKYPLAKPAADRGKVVSRRHRVMKGCDGDYRFLSEAQLQAQLDRCLSCEDEPCRKACPTGCNPSYFIRAARQGTPEDMRRAAAHILQMNPLGGVCGVVCPDKFCMQGCSSKLLDAPIEIPSVQAAIVQTARDLGVAPPVEREALRFEDQRVAVVGAGPSGLAAAAVLLRHGYPVDVFEQRRDVLGGLVNTIPAARLPRHILQGDIARALTLGHMTVHAGKRVDDIAALADTHAAVLVCTGTPDEMKAGVEGEEHAMTALQLLWAPEAATLGKRVLVIGGGAVSVDCATTARRLGADVTLLYRRSAQEMPLSRDERRHLFDHDVDVVPRTRVTRIDKQADGGKLTVATVRVDMARKGSGERWSRDVDGSASEWRDIDTVVVAVGLRGVARDARVQHARVFYAGDAAHGASTVVEATAFGKNMAQHVHSVLTSAREGTAAPAPPAWSWEEEVMTTVEASTTVSEPVPLTVDFFGVHTLINPYILSASPLTDGLDLVRKAYRAGWGGAVLKTAFDGQHIHVPAEYMAWMGKDTGFNADNVSAHPLSRVCEEIGILRNEFPDHLTIGSTGGPMSGDLEFDRKGWQSNTLKLEAAGAQAVEYSLSCPQGGDGSEGAIASQSATVAARIVGWVMSVSDANIPKLFKLTGAVTSIAVIVRAIKAVLDEYPEKKAGITLANSFPTLVLRDMGKPGRKWEEGIVMGMSGRGVLPISYLTLASAAPVGVHISGNGGIIDHISAANFLALGCDNVQLCTLPTKEGVRIIEHLRHGLSQLLQARGFASVQELIGCAHPNAVRDFMDLSAVKKVSSCDDTLCIQCGNCTRCPYDAIHIDEATGYPSINPERCVGCTFCVLNCPSNALAMRERTAEETQLMEREHNKTTA